MGLLQKNKAGSGDPKKSKKKTKVVGGVSIEGALSDIDSALAEADRQAVAAKQAKKEKQRSGGGCCGCC